jgi:hypothetical protein
MPQRIVFEPVLKVRASSGASFEALRDQVIAADHST